MTPDLLDAQDSRLTKDPKLAALRIAARGSPMERKLYFGHPDWMPRALRLGPCRSFADGHLPAFPDFCLL